MSSGISQPTSQASKCSERLDSAMTRQVMWKLNLHLHRGSLLSTEPDVLLFVGDAHCELVEF